MEGTSSQRKRLPPRWFIRIAWAVHRAITRLTGGRRGLWLAKPGKWGTMRLTTVGRRPGRRAARSSATTRMVRTWSRWR